MTAEPVGLIAADDVPIPQALRVLDVGCGDGAVALWARDQLLAAGAPAVELYGVEADPQLAARAHARGIDVIADDWHGLTDDALLHDVPEFDAVVCFELVEHVEDPDALLAVLEAVLAPGGTIYISSPDGTFGAGNNPNHLRVYRSIDLAELLRARGRLTDMAVGRDGITVAAYQPCQRTRRAAIIAPSPTPWSPMDIEHRGLGGSETAATRLAEELCARGWLVTVYGHVEQMAWRDGVIFRDLSVFDPMEPRDVLISSRYPAVFDRPTRADVNLLWLHDTDCGPELTPARAARVDRVLTLSAWHDSHVQRLYPFLQGRTFRFGNGIHPPYFAGPEVAGARRRRVLYTSSPDRGLDRLLELWPRVRAKVPDAELAYCYSPVYWQLAEQPGPVQDHAQHVAALTADREGVEGLGALSQPALASLMRESMVWAYPSWCTPLGGPFHETSCIGAMEAQAAGLHVVASNWGALTETVQVGDRIDGPGPGSPGWEQAFVDSIVAGLTDPDVAGHAQRAGPMAAADMTWTQRTDELVRLVDVLAPSR